MNLSPALATKTLSEYKKKKKKQDHVSLSPLGDSNFLGLTDCPVSSSQVATTPVSHFLSSH
jgi:hypothetical protein